MKTQKELRTILATIDQKGYPAYKSTKGTYAFGNYVLNIDHVQGDPFASPSAISVEVPAGINVFPQEYWKQRHRRIALEDYLVRTFGALAEKYSFKVRGSGKSGLIQVSHPGQEILERTSCHINPSTGDIIMRLDMGFPAQGRTVLAYELEKMLFEYLPDCVADGLIYRNLNRTQVEKRIHLADDQLFLRDALEKLDLCAFLADGSVLPRESGVSDRPLEGAIPFRTPDSMRVTLQLPHHGQISGMGIEKGITLIVGGGFHGKSTLLKAIERGVYNHIEGDGREFVVTDSTAVKIRAEDGRSIAGTDISLFINNLPGKGDTKRFYTDNASGSTSQAANVVEAMEAKAEVLLIDEDTSATNFMVRDELMQRVITKRMEPITPYISCARKMADEKGISTILAAGSSGEWFYHADSIIQMDHYVPKDITREAKKIADLYAREKKELEKMAEIGREVADAMNQQVEEKGETTGNLQLQEETLRKLSLDKKLTGSLNQMGQASTDAPEEEEMSSSVVAEGLVYGAEEETTARPIGPELAGERPVDLENGQIQATADLEGNTISLNEEELMGMEDKISAQIHEMELADHISGMIEVEKQDQGITWPRLRRRPVPSREFAGERLKVKIDGKNSFTIGHEMTDLRYLEQLCDPEQARMIAAMLVYAERNMMNGRLSMEDIVTELVNIAEFSGLEELTGSNYAHGGFAMPRPQEILAGFSRYRGLKMVKKKRKAETQTKTV